MVLLAGQEDIEVMVKEFGEDKRRLIEDSLRWLEEREPSWGLRRSMNRRGFIRSLISRIAE